MPVRPPRRRTMPSSPRSAPTTPLRGGAKGQRPTERGLDAPAFAVGPPNCNGVPRHRVKCISPLDAGVRGVHVRLAVLRLLNGETGALDHRCEQPAERAVLFAQVRLQLGARPADVCLRRYAGEPGVDDTCRLPRLTGEDEVAQVEHAAGFHERRNTIEGESFPEVRQVVQGVARIDEIGAVTLVLVAQKAALHTLDVRDAQLRSVLTQRGEHHRRDVHRYHTAAERGGSQREGTCARAEVDERMRRVEAERAQRGQVVSGVCGCLLVVTRHVVSVQVLATGMGELVEVPARMFHWSPHYLRKGQSIAARSMAACARATNRQPASALAFSGRRPATGSRSDNAYTVGT